MDVFFGLLSGLIGIDLWVIQYVAGDVFRVRCWHNVWCGTQLLKVLYPKLYSLYVEKDVFVHSCLEVLKRRHAHSLWILILILSYDWN